jgi:hypothetical protein
MAVVRPIGGFGGPGNPVGGPVVRQTPQWPANPVPNRGPMPLSGGPRQGMVVGTFHKGGKVKKTGNYRLKKGEGVIQLKSMRHL